MMPHHARTVSSFPEEVLEYLLWYFRARHPSIRDRELVTVPIAEVGAGQADVVLALLRGGYVRHAEVLVGHSIRHCPPCLHVPRAQMEFMDPTGDEARRFRGVMKRNPRLSGTQAFYRYRVIREGMTVQQALIRGTKRRDIRLGLRRGWFHLEDAR